MLAFSNSKLPLAVISQATNYSNGAGSLGTVITPGAGNVKGSYVGLSGTFAPLMNWERAQNPCFLGIKFISGAVAAAARDILVDIAYEEVGVGSSPDRIVISNLLASCAAPETAGGGQQYFFPLQVGTTTGTGALLLQGRASVNNATAGAVTACITAYNTEGVSGASYRGVVPHDTTLGMSVETLGVVPASSRGTLITPGNGGVTGLWTVLGITQRNTYAWQVGLGINDATMNLLAYTVDLAFGTVDFKVPLVLGAQYVTTASEQIIQTTLNPPLFNKVPVGSTIYTRVTCSGTPDSNVSVAAYGVQL